jgi:serine/threonine protein kinase/outer membrane protein assembly factor BamB
LTGYGYQLFRLEAYLDIHRIPIETISEEAMSSQTIPTGPLPSNTLASGTTLAGRYQIDRVIGTGGMGTVYLAQDRRFRTSTRLCAVKEMFDTLTDPALRQKARESFEREANLLASLSHNAIPKVFDYFTEGSRHYLVSEYVEGQDLARVLYQKSRPIPPEKVIDWTIQLTSVLEALHTSQPPIIFRDLKPSNIMLRPDGRIVLVDFGIAKHFQPVQRGTMIGTEGYAPPEQYEGVADPTVDIYALGATMHQLLTNTDPQEYRPFSFHQRPITQHNPQASSELQEAVMKALAYDSSDRWQSMTDLRETLEQMQPAPARRDTPPSGLPRGITSLLDSPISGTRPLGGVSRLFQRKMEGQNGEGAATQPLSSPPPPASNGNGNGNHTQIISRPSPAPGPAMTQPLQVSPGGQGPMPAFTRALGAAAEPTTNEPTVVPLWTFATEDEVRSTPYVTADALYIGSYDTNLYCLDIATGDFKWKHATRGGIPGTPGVWNDVVIIGSEDHQVYGINRHNGKMEWTGQTQGRVRSSPRVAMDHVYVGSDDGHVYAFSTQRGHLQWKAAVGAPVRSTAITNDSMLFIGAEDGSIVGIEMFEGDIRWRVRAGGPVISSPTLAAERVVVGSMDKMLYGLDPTSGWVVYRVRLNDRIYSSPFPFEDKLFVASVDGTLYCLEAEWGREVWKLSLGAQVTSSPVVTPDGKLFIGARNGTVYCVDAHKGKHLWRFATGGPVPGSPRLGDGMIYFGSMDHRVYALPIEAPASASTLLY